MSGLSLSLTLIDSRNLQPFEYLKLASGVRMGPYLRVEFVTNDIAGNAGRNVSNAKLDSSTKQCLTVSSKNLRIAQKPPYISQLPNPKTQFHPQNQPQTCLDINEKARCDCLWGLCL